MKPKKYLLSDREERKIAFNLIILLGMVSLFGDITHEGARSVTGPFLLTLGAKRFFLRDVQHFIWSILAPGRNSKGGSL